MTASDYSLGKTTQEAARAASGSRLDVERVTMIAVFAFTALLILAPIVYLLYGSTRSESPMSLSARFSLQYWREVYGTLSHVPAFVNTVILSGSVAGISVFLGAVMAWIVARTNAPGRKILAPLLVVPLMISSLVTTIAWIALAAPTAGFLNAGLQALFGLRGVFNIYSFTGIVTVSVLHYASFAFIPVYAALRSIDGALEEASYILGASPLKTAFRMTIPLTWPALAASFLMIFIFVAENFSVPHILGAPFGYQTLASEILVAIGKEPANPPLAATISTTLLWIAVVGTIWQRRISRNAGRYVTVAGKGNRHLVANLGKWRFAATAILVLYLFLAVVLPYLALIGASFMRFITPRITLNSFTLVNYERLMTSEFTSAVFNSLLLAIGCGLAGTLVYTLIAYLIKRAPNGFGRAADYLVMVPTVTPALVLGIGILWAYVWVPLPIYGTIWILVAAYMTRFVGQGVRQSRAALVQISEELPEAARMAGAGPLQSFRDIVLPLLKPSLVSLWTILFIFIFMEISLTIVLYSPNSLTLPILLWARMTSGFVPAACAIAVMQATIVFAVIFIADRAFGTLRQTLGQ
jgi:iron(III) transport system permease protein